MTYNPLVLLDARIYVQGADLTGYSNKVEAMAKAEDLDRTTFGSGGWHERIGGLFDGSANVEGFWGAGDQSAPDDMFWGQLGNQIPVSLVPTLGTVGQLAYLTKALACQYTPGGKDGELLAFNADMPVSWPIVRGAVIHPQGTARTTTGTGTSVQLGAVPSDKCLYVCLHVLGASGTTPSLTVKMQSDNATGFPSATDQGTFTAATTYGGQTMKIAGPITDDWWRVAYTISGTSPSFLFAVTAGIGPR